MHKTLPQNLTSYDLLKTFAVITMIIDHIGYYFFPEQLEWRVVGRMSMPVWLFLVGYANTRQIPEMLWMGALILVAGNIIVGMPIFTLNILFGIMLVRLTLDKIISLMLSNNIAIVMGIVFMLLAFLPTNALIEYGTFCYLFAILGYVIRHNKFTENGLTVFMLAITLPYLLFEKVIMGMNQTDLYIMAVLVTATIWFLQYFKSKECKNIQKQFPGFVVQALKFTGRNTLFIYVGHLMLFKIMALFIMSDRYQFLDFRLF